MSALPNNRLLQKTEMNQFFLFKIAYIKKSSLIRWTNFNICMFDQFHEKNLGRK